MQYTYLEVIGYLIVLITGILSHFFKKKIQGETLSDIKEYFREHFKSTCTTVVAALITFGALIAANGLGIIAVFTTGYTADSLFNKAPGDAKV